ncbi:MAG: hypothetical protein HY266_08160 [Deltaproteobacteria bacterium]|nr:hypothetical protein [Deltaproteobacteria bacterium]
MNEICATCGKPVKRPKNLVVPGIIGSLAGLAIGIGFVIYWFGIYAGFFHAMAIIHEIAGTLLGLAAGLIVGFLRK